MIISQSVKHLQSNIYSSSVAEGFKRVNYDLSNKNEIRSFIIDSSQNITSPIIFKDEYRKSENFISADHTTLDFDDGFSTIEIQNELNKLQKDLTIITIPSRSYNISKDDKPACERFHVTVLFNRTITDEVEYKMVTKYLIEQLSNIKIDKAVKDSGRMIFPSFYSSQLIRQDVLDIIEEEIDIQVYSISTYNIITLDVDNIIEIVKQRQLNDSKTFETKEVNIDLTDENEKVKLESAIEFLKSQTLDHTERWYISCCINRDLGYEQMKNIITSLDNSPGNIRIFNELKNNSKKYNENGLDKFYGFCYKKGWKYNTIEYNDDLMDLPIIQEELQKIEQYKKNIQESNIKLKNLESVSNKTSVITQQIKNIKDEIKQNENEIIDSEKRINRSKKLELNKRSLDDVKRSIDNNKREYTLYKTNIIYKNDNYMEFFNSFCGMDNNSKIIVQFSKEIKILSKKDAQTQFSDIKYTWIEGDKKRTMLAFDKWLEGDINTPLRKGVELVCKPNYIAKDNEINTFNQTYTISPNYNIDESVIEIFDNYILNVLCRGNREYANVLWRYNANVIQYNKCEISPQFIGDQGTGKTLNYTILASMLGEDHCISITNSDLIVGQFNSLLLNKTLVLFDEVSEIKSKSASNMLKSLINGDRIAINPKGSHGFIIDNNISFMFASNDDYITRLDKSDRRYFVLETDPKYSEKINGKDNPLNREMFNPIFKIIGSRRNGWKRDDEKLGMLLAYLLQIEVGNLVDDLPNTTKKEEIKQNSLSEFEQWMVSIYKNDGIIYDSRGDLNIDLINCKYQIRAKDGYGMFSRVFTSMKLLDLYNKQAHHKLNAISFGRQINRFSKKIKIEDQWCNSIDLNMIKQNIGINIDLINI